MPEARYVECCATYGEGRVIKRGDLLQYRSWQFLFTFKGSVMQELWKWALGYGMVGFFWVTVYKITMEWEEWDDVSLEVHKLLSIPIAFLIVFRSNVAHSRFWEGRGHMGSLYGTLRSMARKAITLIDGNDDQAHALRSNICRMLPVMAVAIKNNLRHRSKGSIAAEETKTQLYREEISEWLTRDEVTILLEKTENKPMRVIAWIGHAIIAASNAGRLAGGDPTFASFDGESSREIDSWMGMHKICFTPTPFPYIHALHWFMCIWLITLPVPLAPLIEWWTCIAVAMLACAMYAIEEVAAEIEDPFGDDLNDLPTETIAPGICHDIGLLSTMCRPVILAKDGLTVTALKRACLAARGEASWEGDTASMRRANTWAPPSISDEQKLRQSGISSMISFEAVAEPSSQH